MGCLYTGSATGDPDFVNSGLTHGLNPFSKHDDMTGPYAVYYVLYEAVARGLTEDDPTTTDWEGSKGMMNNGEIATMVLGSWAITQIQGAGDNADDIGYMSFRSQSTANSTQQLALTTTLVSISTRQTMRRLLLCFM